MRFLALLFTFASSGCLSLENRFVYFPTPAPQTAKPLAPPLEDVYLSDRPGQTVHARWCPAADTKWVVLYCHGNAGNLHDRGGLVFDFYRKLGASVLIFDYPGYGKSEGTPSETACYSAAQAAYDWLVHVKKIPPRQIIVCGESLGGGVATELASRNKYGALVLIRTFTSLPEVAQAHFPWLPCRAWMSNRFDSEERMGKCLGPLFIAYADKDHIMPRGHAQRLKDAQGSGVKFVFRARIHRLEGLGHNDPLPDDFFAALRGYLSRELGDMP